MSDLISRKETLRAIDSLGECYISYYKLLMLIGRLPSAEPERTAKVECIAEVYRGETVDHYLSGICEICGESTYNRAKYCSGCGAKLDWNWNE